MEKQNRRRYQVFPLHPKTRQRAFVRPDSQSLKSLVGKMPYDDDCTAIKPRGHLFCSISPSSKGQLLMALTQFCICCVKNTNPAFNTSIPELQKPLRVLLKPLAVSILSSSCSLLGSSSISSMPSSSYVTSALSDLLVYVKCRLSAK